MTTRTLILTEMGRADAPVGSRDWALAVCRELQHILSDINGDASRLRAMIALMREHRGYKHLTNAKGKPFASFEQFCCEREPYGLGYARDDIDRIIAERADAQARMQAALPLAEHGTNQHESGHDNVMSTVASQGNSADYLAARIKRDAPDIAAAVERGEIKSIHAAAVKAGIVKRTVQVPLIPDRAAKLLAKHFAPDQLDQLIAELGRLRSA